MKFLRQEYLLCSVSALQQSYLRYAEPVVLNFELALGRIVLALQLSRYDRIEHSTEIVVAHIGGSAPLGSTWAAGRVALRGYIERSLRIGGWQSKTENDNAVGLAVQSQKDDDDVRPITRRCWARWPRRGLLCRDVVVHGAFPKVLAQVHEDWPLIIHGLLPFVGSGWRDRPK